MNILTFSSLLNRQPNCDGNWLVGDGFLYRGGSVLITGQPGVGKSKFAQHFSLNLALGRTFAGLKPVKALRVLYVQAEDTEDDLHYSVKGFADGLTEEDCSQIDRNWFVDTIHGKSGSAFVGHLQIMLETHRPDVLVTDPLFAYIGCDLINQAEVTSFLRGQMLPLLVTKKCGWVCVHHANKGSASAKGDSQQKALRSLGTMEIPAFFRGIIDLEMLPDQKGILMEVVKRQRQADLRNSCDQNVTKLHLSTGTDKISWSVSN